MKAFLNVFTALSALIFVNTVLAASTQMVNNSVEGLPITIVYKVCNITQYPAVCEQPKQVILPSKKVLQVELVSGQKLFVLTAQINSGDAVIAASTYTSQAMGGSYCNADPLVFISLNTFYTNRIGCLVIKG